MSNDKKTTILGAILAALIMTRVDWTKVFQGDPTNIGIVVGALVTALLGYYTNKSSPPPVQ